MICFVSSLGAADIPVKDTPAAPAKLHFFSGLWGNLADTFWGSPGNIAAWVSVPVSTSVMVNTNLDERINSAVSRSPVWSRGVDQGFLQVGNFAAAVPHTLMFFYGYFWGSSETAAAGAAGLQALGVNGGIVFFWKWASGRPRPEYDAVSDSTPRDKEFNFNIAEQSVTSGRWRWPSGHTSSMFAMASAFHGFYPDKPWIPWVGYSVSGLMGFAMINGNYHWASDVVAGAIIGTVVGFTIGRNFRRMYAGTQAAKVAADGRRSLDWYLTPRQTENGMALAMTALF
jgi:membrane-associated phospholipid phosphatase